MGRRCPHCKGIHETHAVLCTATGARLEQYSDIGGDDVLVGSVVADRYHVAGILGQGSTGTVFGVEHIHFGRRAAMKVLRPRLASADLVHHVVASDARAAWAVGHPCLAEVFDIGTLPDGAPFFVTEYLEGETLAKRIARDRVSLAAAVDVMMQLLSAIAAVHARSLVVRDLRPENVFLSHRRGCRPIAKVLDLGLARLTPLEMVAEQWEADPAVASTVLTQPYYLSPERTRSEKSVEPASDLFVAGVIFYEMLTGKRPFSATTYPGLLLQIAQGNPTPVTELRDHALAELDEYMERALSGNPRNRFATAKEMQDELRRIFEGVKRAGTSTAMHAVREREHSAPPSATGSSFAPESPATRETTLAMQPADNPNAVHPAQDEPETARPPTNYRSPSEPDAYADETETDRKFFDVSPYRERAGSESGERPTPGAHRPNSSLKSGGTRRGIGSALGSASRPRLPKPYDEASAESPHKTVPPRVSPTAMAQPPTVEAFRPIAAGFAPIDADDEELTEARHEGLDPILREIREANRVAEPITEEETAQMALTPELRARLEATARKPVRAPAPSEGDSIPPPTKRLDKP